MHIACIGIDLGKITFHLVAWGERNKILLRKKFSAAELIDYTKTLYAQQEEILKRHCLLSCLLQKAIFEDSSAPQRRC